MCLEPILMSEIAGFAYVLGVECERKRGFRHYSRDNSSPLTTSFSFQNPQRSLRPVTVRGSVFNQHKIAFALLSGKDSRMGKKSLQTRMQIRHS